jgi:MFS family permease
VRLLNAAGPDDDGEYHTPAVVGSLVLGVFLGGIGGGVAFPTLPTLGTVLGLSPLVVGLILSANRFTRLVMSTPAGQLIDRLSVRKPMIVGFLLQGTPPFGYILGLHPEHVPLLDSAGIFVLSRVIWGLGAALVFVGGYSTVVQITTTANRGKWVGYFRGGQSLGYPTGLVLGGLLTDLYGYEVAFGTAGILGLLAVAVAAAIIPDIRISVDEPTRLRDVPALVRSDSRIVMVGTVNFVTRLLFAGILLSTIVLYADANDIRIGMITSVGVSGVVMALSIFCVSVATIVAGRISDRLDNRVLVTVPSLGGFAFGFAVLGTVPVLPATLLGVACIGAGLGGTNPPLLAYLGDIGPEQDAGKLGGVYNAFGDTGSTLGPLLALPMADIIGYRTGYLLCAALAGILVMFLTASLWLSGRAGQGGRDSPKFD